ncbi:hypothetical protein M9H77_03173 [Catharanthus roseus]|uniref:Uncharacterized protein n=1 Tax=Catharanthus roseus TaxID=4058 RepID=A0ACC0CAN5_CATRO|nr:hypothetical protein M9H77_03173 [Catharanthus roseus]
MESAQLEHENTQNAKLASKWCQSEQLPKDTNETARSGVLNAMSNRMNFAGKTHEGIEKESVLISLIQKLPQLRAIIPTKLTIKGNQDNADVVGLSSMTNENVLNLLHNKWFGVVIPLSVIAEIGALIPLVC